MEQMNAQQAAEWGKNLDFPQVWTALMETRAQQAETAEQIRQMSSEVEKMSIKVDATTESVKKSIEEMAAEAKKRDKRMGDFANTLGTLIETLIAARLWEKFPEYKLARAYQRVMIYDEKNNPKTDIDILLSNDSWAMAVEVKREANMKDIDHHLKRMELVRQYPIVPVALRDDIRNKKLLGAIAGGVVPPDVREYAQQCGLFVLELNGEQVSRIVSPEGFVAREW